MNDGNLSCGLLRYQYNEGLTRGVFFLPSGGWVHTLELPWKENATGVSCIPTGQYEVRYLPRSASGKYRKVYHVLDVKGRTGILIHAGNYPRHTLGCILVGTTIGPGAIYNSQKALRVVRGELGTSSFKLTVGDL